MLIERKTYFQRSVRCEMPQTGFLLVVCTRKSIRVSGQLLWQCWWFTLLCGVNIECHLAQWISRKHDKRETLRQSKDVSFEHGQQTNDPSFNSICQKMIASDSSKVLRHLCVTWRWWYRYIHVPPEHDVARRTRGNCNLSDYLNVPLCYLEAGSSVAQWRAPDKNKNSFFCYAQFSNSSAEFNLFVKSRRFSTFRIAENTCKHFCLATCCVPGLTARSSSLYSM